MMRVSFTQRRAGVTLSEMLVVLVIISLLSTIAVPVYVNRAEDARRATALDEVRNIAEAMDMVGIFHGFYVPIQLLDDIPGDESSGLIGSDADAIGLEDSSIKLIDVNSSLEALTAQPSLSDDTSNARVRSLIQNWQGPFMSFQRVFISDSDTADPGPGELNPFLKKLDHPLDPWGQPYRFYSPRGLVGAAAVSTDPTVWASESFSDGTVTTQDDRFDRFAIVSLGPNQQLGADPGVPGGEVSDDIFYEFGKINLLANETGFFNQETFEPGDITLP